MISTVLVFILMILVTLENNLIWKYMWLGILVVVSILGVVWSLWENAIGIVKLMILILPGLLSLGAGVFSFLLPLSVPWFGSLGSIVFVWILRIGFWIAWMFSYYTILATENIYAVSSIRKIPLARAASVAGLILTLVCGFFVYDGIWSFKLNYYMTGVLIFLLSFPLALQSLWSANFELKITRNLLIGTFVCAYGAGLLGTVLSFWDIWISLASILVVVWLYVSLGIMHHWLIKRLFNQMVWEYLFVGIVVPLVIIGLQFMINY